jgi:hypothetical protein
MDYETYRRRNFVDPPPTARFRVDGLAGVALYLPHYEDAVRFYAAVLGPPAYVEGESTHGWRLGDAWLTLFPGDREPAATEIHLRLADSVEVDRLHAAFLAAGATGPPPSNEYMFDPIRFGQVTDPFGTVIVLVADLDRTG